MKLRYSSELIRSMNYLGEKRNTIFLGQSVKFSGNAMYNTLTGVPNKKKIELPVFEDNQMGMSIGLAINGFVPITCYPRFDFLLLAMNQLVNHLDKLNIMTNDHYKSKAIIRTSIGSDSPLNPNVQHLGDFTSSVAKMCKNLNIVKLNEPNLVFKEYKKCSKHSCCKRHQTLFEFSSQCLNDRYYKSRGKCHRYRRGVY